MRCVSVAKALCAGVVWVAAIAACGGVRLCERMTPCDLQRFIRTHRKQIASVDEKTVRVDFLTLNLYNEGVDLRRKVDALESGVEHVTAKRSWLLDADDEDHFRRVDHRAANHHLHQLIMVLRKWLTDVRTTLNATLREALEQREAMARLDGGVRGAMLRARALGAARATGAAGVARAGRRPEEQSELEPALSNNCLFCNGNSKRRYSLLGADKGFRLATDEMKNIKISLSTMRHLVNETEQNCFQKLTKLASRIEHLSLKLKTLEST